MTFIVGTIFAGEPVTQMYAGFPVDLFVLLAGVTYLFAVASNNGTVERIIEGAARLVKDRRALIPWIVFVAASLPAMAGAIGSAGVAILAPLSLRLAERYDIDRRMIGLMVIYGAGAGNFCPLNVLGAIVTQTVTRSGLSMSSTALFVSNLVYNTALAAVIYLLFGGLRLAAKKPRLAFADTETVAENATDQGEERPGRLRADHVCTLLVLLAVAVAALGFGLNIGFLGFCAAVLLPLIFPASCGGADRQIAWLVVVLVCRIHACVVPLHRYGTVQAVGDGIAAMSTPIVAALLICAVGAIASAFASSAGILGAMIPLAVPFMARGEIPTTALVVALAISATVVDSTPFSTVGALDDPNAADRERPQMYRGLLWWDAAT